MLVQDGSQLTIEASSLTGLDIDTLRRYLLNGEGAVDCTLAIISTPTTGPNSGHYALTFRFHQTNFLLNITGEVSESPVFPHDDVSTSA